jgi:TMEM175 potassium channel family protein
MARRWESGRTEAFSDGVFAIAITLLVLDLHVPQTEFHDLWRGILHEWPAYLAYVTSFTAIGGLWLAHHGIFHRLRFVNDQVMRINLLLLMGVSFLPFPTRLMSEAIRNEDAARVAVIFYGISLFLVGALGAALWGAVVRDRDLLNPEVTDQEVRQITLALTPHLGFYVGATIFAIFFPRGAAVLYLVIAVLGVIRARPDTDSDSDAVATRSK